VKDRGEKETAAKAIEHPNIGVVPARLVNKSLAPFRKNMVLMYDQNTK
jgi:hypothetical protein